MSTNTNIIARVNEAVESTLEQCAVGEGAEYAASIQMLPGNQPGQFIPAIFVVITMPGVVLGEKAQALSTILNLGVTHDDLVDMTRGMVEGIRKSRSDYLSAQDSPSSAQNGSGLIVP